MNRPVPFVLAALFAATVPLPAQEVALPTPEEYARKAAEAAAAPLFATSEPLVLTLSADISWIRDVRSDEDEVDGSVRYVDASGTEVTVPVKVRARGNFRRDKSNCNFPPLRLNFAGKSVEGSVFEGQDKLKLVTPCRDNRDSFQQYVIQEYLVYRVFQLFTPASFRVRQVRITYEDPDGGYDLRTRTGFLIEADEQLAHRNRATLSEWNQFHPDAMEAEQASLVSLFQYMIGNTDFSLPLFHNAVMIRDEAARYLMVPYDFDWAGVVDAGYARPDPLLGTRNVTERVYRGFCREGVDHQALIRRFNEQRDAVTALYDGEAELEDGQRRRALGYYQRFYETLNDSRKFEREILARCRQALGGDGRGTD